MVRENSLDALCCRNVECDAFVPRSQSRVVEFEKRDSIRAD